MKNVFICSPFRGAVVSNIRLADEIVKAIMEDEMGDWYPIAPHLILPNCMDDTDPKQRKEALRICKRLLLGCDELWLWTGCTPTDGMSQEIATAQQHKIPIRTLCMLDDLLIVSSLTYEDLPQ